MCRAQQQHQSLHLEASWLCILCLAASRGAAAAAVAAGTTCTQSYRPCCGT
jgi:hypothetical protein